MTTILQPWQGGTGVSSVGAYGNPEIVNGVWSFAKAARSVKYYGAVGDGNTDDSAAIQAAIDSDYPAIYFEPDGIYKLSSPVVIDSITDGNITKRGRLIHGMGSRILSDSLANCFQFVDDVYPNNHKYTQFHDFVFTGSCSDSFIKWTANYSWYNQLYNLRTDPSGTATTALIKLENSLAASNPGMFTIRNCESSRCKHTIFLTKSGTGLGVYDDFHLYELTGGDYQEHASCITVNTGSQLVYSHIHDVTSGGPHAVNAYGADISKSRIERIYLEVPAHTVPLPTNFANNWGVAGTITDCSISDIWGYISNRVDHPGMRAVYMAGDRVTIKNVGIHCVSDSGPPYAVTYYPAIEIVGDSDDITYDFPERYYTNGVSSSGLHHNYLAAPIMLVKNVTDTFGVQWCRDTQISNYGQGAGAAVITLPAPKSGMRMRFVMTATGKSYSIKAGPTDKIILNGTALDDGDKVSNTNTAIGDAIYFYAFNSGYTSGSDYDYDWVAITEGGTWVDGGA